MKNNIKTIVLCLLFSTPALALQSINDEELSKIDGKAGITIESQLHDTSTIGEISYTDSDGDGDGHTDSAGIYLSDISIGASSAKTKIDVLSDGTLNIEISDIVQGDIWVRNIAMGDPDTSFGAVGITNFDYDEAGSYNIQFGIVDPDGDGINQAAIILDFNMASSSYDFTFIDEADFSLVGAHELTNGHSFSYATQFSDFRAEATTVYADDSLSSDGRDWIKLVLGDITGSVRFDGIAFNSMVNGVAGTSEVLGSAGLSNIKVDPTGFLALSSHAAGAGVEGIDLKIASKMDIENFYFETEGSRVNFGNIAFDTDGRGTNGDSNVPFDINLDAVNSGFRKGLVLAISNVNAMDLTIRDLYVSQYDKLSDTVSNEAVFGSIGLENINFNGGVAELYIIGRGGVGVQGTETGLSLPDGTTLEFTINDYEDTDGDGVSDKGGALRANVEINDFSMSSTMDVVQLGKDANGVEQGTGLQIIFNGLEGAFDVTKFTAGDGSRAGSFGRIQIDGLQMRRGYLIVDALGN